MLPSRAAGRQPRVVSVLEELRLSPGDQYNPSPYLYVGPWGGIDADDDYWSAESFPGAALGYDTLLAAPDQRSAALEFFTAGYERLRRR